jgi:hypothetical protein
MGATCTFTSVSTMPKALYDVLGLKPMTECSLSFHLADSMVKKPLGRINDIPIIANINYVPVDFIIMDIECNTSCPIILGRPFLRTICAIIDMKECNIKFKFPMRKGMELFPRKKIKLPYETIMMATYSLGIIDEKS